MKFQTVLSVLGGATLLAVVGQTESRPPWLQDKYENLNFAQGAPGKFPPGWQLGPLLTTDYDAEIVSQPVCQSLGQCATLKSVSRSPSGLSFLYQVFDATPHRGKKVLFRAAVRAEVTDGNVARLLVRVHRGDGTTSFRDDMGNFPIKSSQWAFYEINAPIVSDARDVEFGMQLVGRGAAWIDNISLEFSE